MTDSDNHNHADNDSDARAASDTKRSQSKRTSDIYERFLSRVQQLDSEVKENKVRKSEDDGCNQQSLYEPLNEEELGLFFDFIDNDSTHNTQDLVEPQYKYDYIEEQLSIEKQLSTAERLDNKDGESVNDSDSRNGNQNNDIAIENIDETTDADVSIHNQLTKNVEQAKTSGAVRGKQVSNVKLLIIGVVCGLLLSASMIFLLNKTGLLAALSNNSVADSSEALTPSATMNAPVTPASTSQSTAVATADSPESNTITAQKASSNNATTTQLNSEIIPESDITYEDFREESQSTLYRETKD